MKKIFALVACLSLVASLAIGGSIAYLQDQDSAVNVMTLGKVEIKQIEQQLADDGVTLEDFKQGKDLYPGCEISKIVSVENTGKSDAYFRTLIAFEDIESDTFSINFPISEQGYRWSWGAPEATIVLDGVTYQVYEALYTSVLEAGKTSPVSLTKVELAATAIHEDMEKLGGTYEILVLSQAVQAAGFNDAATALDTAFGDVNNTTAAEWFGGIEVPSIWTGEADTAWYDAAATEYTLNTAEELAGLAELVNGGETFKGKTIKLNSDLDLNNKDWTPIGSTFDTPFEGDFDGQGHTISNLYINVTEKVEEGVGLIGTAMNSDIKNITVENANVTGYQESAAIVGAPYSGCTISNCHVTGDINIVSNFAYAGGIAAYGYVDIENCSVIADSDKRGVIMAKEKNAVGGIIAWLLENNNSVVNCEVKNLDLTGWTNVGSITGFLHYNNTMDGCKAENITLTKTRGADGNPGIGVATGGWCYGANKVTTISNNTFNNITLNATSKEYTLDDNNANLILYGSEYYGRTDISNFNLSNNTLKNITDNRTTASN